MPKLSFKAFLSHAYDAAELNIEFFRLFDDVADVHFEVDIGFKNLNVTRLERRIRDCDAFVGLYPYPGDWTREPAPGDALQASTYFRLELELAIRAGRPGIVYYDERYQSAMPALESISAKSFIDYDLQGGMTTRLRSQIKTTFQEFCSRLDPELQGRASGFKSTRDQRAVGFLVPRGRGGYPEQAIDILRQVASERGHRLVDLGWPPVADAGLFDRLDSLNWVFADVGPQMAATGMLGLIHSRFVPAIRMHRGIGPPDAATWTASAVGRLFGALDVGYRKDIVYWRNDVVSLDTQLRSRVQVALRPPGKNEVIKSPQEALNYFRLAREKRRVFVSYAGADRSIAEQLVAVLRGHFPTVFDYLDRGESLPPGSEWREKIKSEIVEAQFGVLVISQSYISSGYCKWEKDLLVDAHQDRGVPLFPILLEGRARDLPVGLESVQVTRLGAADSVEELALGIVRTIEKLPTTAGTSA